ncbi:hypothetical protein FM076_19905 [Streptomyces albus subsp. chlorinus]|nr:hypothetical protein [Streptomyces albus subsp. chlorinus]
MADGDSVVLQILSSQRVVMTLPDRCDGKVSGTTLDLTCDGGESDYAHGTIKSASGPGLTVSWDSGRTVKLQRMKDELPPPPPKQPTGFPSAEDPF